jgi:hypothetical protein
MYNLLIDEEIYLKGEMEKLRYGLNKLEIQTVPSMVPRLVNREMYKNMGLLQLASQRKERMNDIFERFVNEFLKHMEEMSPKNQEQLMQAQFDIYKGFVYEMM